VPRGSPKKVEERRQALVVLGMHRSGTSALARLLILLGADPPRNVMPADPGNETGHWEPISIVDLDDEIFSSVSSSWDDVESLPPRWSESKSAARFHDRAVELLAEEYGESRQFVLKDPRMCRLVPFWRSTLESFGAEPAFLIPVRNPLEVAASLKARDGIVPGRGLLLWLRHMLDVELETRDATRAFVSYEQLLTEWRAVMERASQQLGISLPQSSERAAVKIERFLSARYRHHSATTPELEARPEVVEWVKSAYAVLEEALAGGELDRDALDRIRSRLEEADLAYGTVVAELQLDRDQAQAELEASSDELDQRRHELDLALERRNALEHTVGALEEGRANDAARLESLSDQLQAVAGQLQERDGMLAERRAQAESLAARVQALSAQIQERDSLLAEHATRLESLSTELQTQGARLHESEANREETERALASSQALAESRAGELAQQQRVTNELAEWVQHLERSRSFRITTPLRATAASVRRLLRRTPHQLKPPTVSRVWADATEPPAPELPPAPATEPPAETNGEAPAPPWGGGLSAEIAKFTSSGDDFEEFDPGIAAGHARRAKLLAFYLPQFHAIPENDRWWGPGFSEWRNVARGIPRFPGHYQPRLPRDLGFYDLRNIETIRRQVELAGQAGVHGFAFYYYSFNGRRLLESPLEAFLGDPTIQFPFCAAWANENWTRRWDGLDEEILIRQDYDPADDEKLIDDLQRHFDDSRYIRIQGRPLLLVYRFDVVPDAPATVGRWLERWRERHDEDPLIFMVQSFDDDPRGYGADGAIEFPPQRVASWDNSINPQLHFFDPSFSGHVLEYERVARDAISRPVPPYPLVRGVCPSWDNDARRQGGGTVLHGSRPAGYERWLSAAIDAAAENPVLGERMVFLNAWNEWAEGAYLEPDLHYGAAYLNATARAVCGVPKERTRRKVLLVGHDAHPHGAQMNLRALAGVLKEQFGCEIAFLLLEGGALVADYERLGEVELLGEPSRLLQLAGDFRGRGFTLALTNTTASGESVEALKEAGFRVVSLIHELPGLIHRHGLEDGARQIAAVSDRVVFPADPVARAFEKVARVPPDRVEIKPQGLYRENGQLPADAAARVRAELGIPEDARVVLNIGYADMRKGIDIFVKSAEQAHRQAPELHFVWLGNLSPEAEEIRAGMSAADRERVHFAPFTETVEPYLAAADVFFLSSREDPFPAVVLEALSAGLPVVALRGSGGSERLAISTGRLVDRADLGGVVIGLAECAAEESPEAAEARKSLVRDHYQYDRWGFDLLGLLDPALKRISVVVPNYNYAGNLAHRLDSIFEQTYPIFELIVLDDGSEDGSLAELERIRESSGRRFRIVANDRNSGSAFRQWAKACEIARGDYVWIAEADDLCKPEFLDRMAGRLGDDQVAFGFSDSAQIDHQGHLLAESYKSYYRETVGELMDHDFDLGGEEFVRRCLTERNLILNVSSVVWRRTALAAGLECAEEDLSGYELAGDWRLYVEAALGEGRVSYLAEPLNIHRRHDESVTHALEPERHLDEVRRVHTQIARRLTLDHGALEGMRRYESELAVQFGLRPPEDSEHQVEVTEEIRALCRKYAEPLGVTPAVHERDQILRFLLDHEIWSEPDGPIEYYFRDGRTSAERLASLLARPDGNGDRPVNRQSLLEFASGYGCVTRHLGQVLPDLEVVSSDIHSEAIDFLEREIGVPAFISSSAPDDFRAPQQFDVVFALSFFSHMPERTWRRWLATLAGCLAEDGVLIFTTQGAASRQHFGDPVIPESGIWYEASIEQADLDTSEYGQTIVMTDFVRAQIEAVELELVKHEYGCWWDHQDLYVAQRSAG
jgi:hypothetical protein